MAKAAEITFGDFQMDARYKKLARTLKLILLKKDDKNITLSSKNGELSPTWPSLSSIQADPFDTSSINRSSYGSEVVASSNNLRNVVLRKKGKPLHFEPPVSSSVKQYHVGKLDNRALMLPPSVTSVPRSAKKLDVNAKISTQPHSSNLISKNFTDNNPPVYTAVSDLTTKTKSNENYSCSSSLYQAHINDGMKKPERVFRNWCIILNNQGQLIIKGELECGKIARSKPVIRRLTAIRVESIYKHIYCLVGNISDKKRELPDYVRGKFFNGFPDDWVNVCQMWRSFIAQGSKPTFRWPTKITDSDDDLRSEMTDVTLSYNLEQETELLNSINNDKLQISPRRSLRSHRKISNKESSLACQKDCYENVETMSSLSKSYTRDEQKFGNKEQINQNKKQDKILKLILLLQDELPKHFSVVADNLRNKTCPQEYIDKIYELFDCLDYILSFQTDHKNEYLSPKMNVKDHQSLRKSSKSNNQDNHVIDMNDEHRKQKQILASDIDYESEDNNINTHNNQSNEKSKEDKENHLNESEMYSGIPRLPLEFIEKSKNKVKGRYKYKRGKTMRYLGISKKQSINKKTDEKDSKRKFNYMESELSSSDTFSEDDFELVHNSKNNKENENAYNINVGSNVSNQKKQITTEHSNRLIVFSEENKGIQETVLKNNNEIQKTNVIKRPKSNEKIEQSSANQLFTKSIENKNAFFTNVEESQSSGSVKKIKSKDFKTEQVPEKVLEMTRNAQTRPIPRIKKKEKVTLDQKFIDKFSNIKNTIDKSDSDGNINSHVQQVKEQTSNFLPDTSVNNNSCTSDKKVESLYSRPLTRSASSQNLKIKVDSNKLTLLTAWTPQVIELPDKKLSLIFEGKLLNEAGHVMHRKFSTTFVHRRISATKFETVDHKIYELVGHVNDSKHNIPKELLTQCRNGCPAKIDQFCKLWKSLEKGDIRDRLEKENNTSVDNLSVTVSSRGRRILPPLNYWIGERVILKDNIPVYNSGNSQDFETSSFAKSPKKAKKNNVSSNKAGSLSIESKGKGSNDKDKIEGKVAVLNTVLNTKKNPENALHTRRSATKAKKRIAQQLTFSSSDISDDESKYKSKRQKFRNQHIDQEKENIDHKINLRSQKSSETHTGNQQLTLKGSYYGITWTYSKGIPYRDDILSEDQVSVL